MTHLETLELLAEGLGALRTCGLCAGWLAARELQHQQLGERWSRALGRLCASRCAAKDVRKSTEKGRVRGVWAAPGHLERPHERGGLHDSSRPKLEVVDEMMVRPGEEEVQRRAKELQALSF